MADHIVSGFDDDLREIGAIIAEMGGLAEVQVRDGVSALIRGDEQLARQTISRDKQLDNLQRTIEEKATVLIARRQPMAGDLRAIMSSIHIAGDLERIGDLGKNIAKRSIATQQNLGVTEFARGMSALSNLVLSQLEKVLKSYTTMNAELALAVRDRDEEVDAAHTSLFRELLTYMMEDPRTITHCAHLLFCAKNLERIGDHSTNIAEVIYYTATGEVLEDERAKGDDASLVAETDLQEK